MKRKINLIRKVKIICRLDPKRERVRDVGDEPIRELGKMSLIECRIIKKHFPLLFFCCQEGFLKYDVFP